DEAGAVAVAARIELRVVDPLPLRERRDAPSAIVLLRAARGVDDRALLFGRQETRPHARRPQQRQAVEQVLAVAALAQVLTQQLRALLNLGRRGVVARRRADRNRGERGAVERRPFRFPG